MRLNCFFASVLLFSCFVSHAVLVRPAMANEHMSARVADQLGLVEAWNRSVSSPMGVQSISDMELYVHESRPNQYLEVITTDPAKSVRPGKKIKPENKNKIDSAKKKDDNVRVLSRFLVEPESEIDETIVSTNKTTPFSGGSAFRGKKEAERLASNEIRRLKRRGITATTRMVSSPRVGLYSIANDGSLEARDAETGQTLWTTRVGDSRMTYYQIGVNDTHISVVNGGNMIIVRTDTGEVERELVLGRTPIFGAINAGGYAMIQGISGGVVCYSLDDLEHDPYYESVEGYAISQPTLAPRSTKVAWSTDKGFVFVMDMEGTPSTLFRLKTDGLVTGKIAAAKNERFYFGSESGQVYGIRATREGLVKWSQPFGEPFYGEPIVIEQQLFMRSSYNNLYCLSTIDGSQLWDNTVSGVTELVGAVAHELFVRASDGSLMVIHRETGERIGSYPSLQPAMTISNAFTDRLYLVSDHGGIQCLRPISSELPTLNTQPDTIPAATEEEAEAKEDKPKKSKGGMFDDKETKPVDPFGGDSTDPFGGGSSDPFGGGGGDPFGADPFGN
ncbi:Serine/threonine-protein kinase AfsK [Rubripirellula obstinata]|uniref:Serine/threonine-protein kinase AfsK n=1 Tax=Rubripirellula obstinata TaxID=406547 RepID=A0A5B1CEH2_9BACT|nr:PQQ-binding-like beta-propeller repeat protein [Rubripirellula obstinata]KAA1257744.1 Serine/threonine-protein kinase AfsK [Rubripirellula obstinata]